MTDSLRPAPTSNATHQSRTAWDVEIGRLRFAVSRTRETRSVGSAGPAARPPRTVGSFASGAVAGIGAVALLVVGASAAPRPPAPYLVSVPIPAPAQRALVRPTHHTVVAGRSSPRAVVTMAPAAFDRADEPYVVKAMATGAFQEWEDVLGQRRFLTAGPAHVAGGRYCRDMALLVRLAEGGSHVRSATSCKPMPVSTALPPEADPPAEAAD